MKPKRWWRNAQVCLSAVALVPTLWVDFWLTERERRRSERRLAQ